MNAIKIDPEVARRFKWIGFMLLDRAQIGEEKLQNAVLNKRVFSKGNSLLRIRGGKGSRMEPELLRRGSLSYDQSPLTEEEFMEAVRWLGQATYFREDAESFEVEIAQSMHCLAFPAKSTTLSLGRAKKIFHEFITHLEPQSEKGFDFAKITTGPRKQDGSFTITVTGVQGNDFCGVLLKMSGAENQAEFLAAAEMLCNKGNYREPNDYFEFALTSREESWPQE